MYSTESKQSKNFRNILLNNQEWPLRQCLVEYSCYTNRNPEGGKLGNTLSVKTRCERTENVKENEVLDCPYHRDKICILRRLKKTNIHQVL